MARGLRGHSLLRSAFAAWRSWEANKGPRMIQWHKNTLHERMPEDQTLELTIKTDELYEQVWLLDLRL